MEIIKYPLIGIIMRLKKIMYVMYVKFLAQIGHSNVIYVFPLG